MSEIYMPDIKQKYDFNQGFAACCNVLKKRVRMDYDATIAVTGEEGISKSTCANQIGFQTDKDYTLKKNVLFSPKISEIEDKIRNLPRFSTVNGDEAIKLLYKLQWFSPLQIFINKFYRLCRQENKISIFCMPRFYEFNEGFRNHRIILWVHLFDRGFGVVFEKDWSPFAKDPWWFMKNQQQIDQFRTRIKYHEFSFERKISVLSKSKNFLDVITFPDLPLELREEYKILANQYKYEGLSREAIYSEKVVAVRRDKNRQIGKAAILLQKEGYSQETIAKEVGTSSQTISLLVNKVKRGQDVGDIVF